MRDRMRAKPRLLMPLALMAVGLAVILLLHDQATIQEPPPFSLRFDAGSDHPSQDHRGRLYLADQAWTSQTQAGYIGGYRVWNSSKAHPTDGTPDEFLHSNQRHGWEEYRFSNIPNGSYLVTLSFSEIGVPARTVFDVAIEGQVVLEGFRISDHVGGNYALTRRFAVAVTDGELNVNSQPVIGDPRLAAIDVESRSPDAVAPATPVDLAIIGSYRAALLDWADNAEDDLDGYHIYRANSPDGPYIRLTREPTHVSRYQDAAVTPHLAYHYCVSSVDVYGNESARSPCLTGAALDAGDATLPVYELQVPPENLQELYDHIFSDDEVSGSFTYQGRVFPVAVRYRGGYGRYVHKRSWKIKFPNGSPFPSRDEINLRADYADPTLMHTKLATSLFQAAGVRAPEAEHVLLTLNGEYLGVYTFNEQVDQGFLERTGQDASISIYKTIHTDTHDWSRSQPSEEAYYEAYQKETNRDTDHHDVIAFIELINDTPDETFAYELQRAFDVAAYLDYYAVTVLISNGDFVHHNAYLLHDLDADRWSLVPYDFDVTFELLDRPIDEGTATSPIQPREWISVLLTRVLDEPQFRAHYCHHLDAFMDTIFSDETMYALIDTTYAAIEQDGLRDWHKLHREDNAWFTASPDELKAYITDRKAFLTSQIPAYCPADRLYLYINEVKPASDDTSAWFEIYNAGLEAANLSGLYLTDDTSNSTKFRIADGISIPPGGFITFSADSQPGSGLLHTNLQIDETGGQLTIFSGTLQIDACTFGPQTAGISYARYPDGTGNWHRFNIPTPGSSNLLPPPVVGDVSRDPLLPAASDVVTITATITDDGALLTATLHYDATGGEFVAVPMTNSQGDLYTAQIPAQPESSLIRYHVSAGDDDGQTSTGPSGQYIVGYQPPAVLINELMADNEATLSSPEGPDPFPDWIELYNTGSNSVDLGGRHLSDDPNDPTKFQIAPGVTIPPQGFLVFYADNSPDLGPLHTNFGLNREGESVGLFDLDSIGNQPIDTYTFGPQVADVSEGRCPDGDAPWVPFGTPTPGASNSPCGTVPVVARVSLGSPSPSATEAVTVTAVIVGDGTPFIATLWYDVGAGFSSVPMTSTQAHLYAAVLPPQPGNTTVAYYVQAESARGFSITNPPGAPLDAHRYTVGYQPPQLFINEFLADNATTLEDPDQPGEFPDWIELYNGGPDSIDLGGKYLTDDLADPTKFRIPGGLTVPAGGFILFYADGDPEQGPLHLNFRLSRSGEIIGLFDTDATGNRPIDAHAFGWQAPDVSEHRRPDGAQTWATSLFATPGAANEN